MTILASLSRRVALAVAGVAALLVPGPLSFAQQPIANFTGEVSSDWYDSGNWDTNSVPTAAVRVVIGPGKTCVINVGSTNNPLGNPAHADSLWIQGAAPPLLEGKLAITSSTSHSKLLLHDQTDTTNNPVSRIDGLLTIDYFRSALVIVDKNHTIWGRGRIEGFAENQDNGQDGSEIQIGPGLTLTCQLPTASGGVLGSMTISCPECATNQTATFKNLGKVEARPLLPYCSGNSTNDRGVIRVLSSVAISDTIGSQWNATSCGVLSLRPAGTSVLQGDFLVDKRECSNARLSISAPITTTGTLTFKSGQIVACPDTFCAAQKAGSCANILPCSSPVYCCFPPPGCCTPITYTCFVTPPLTCAELYTPGNCGN